MDRKKITIVGGGAAGYFAAICAAETNPLAEVTILEKSRQVLSKVKVSGGGRCNVTHDCYDPKQLTQNYPRGSRELLSAFHAFQPADMLEWLENEGVSTHAESDGRIFPQSNSSQTIIDCFQNKSQNLGVKLLTKREVLGIKPLNTGWLLQFKEDTHQCDALIVCTGSARNAELRQQMQQLGLQFIDPLPSLFTFNIDDERLDELAGISWEHAKVGIKDSKRQQSGPLLVTHWGLSGPAILKLSAWAARELAQLDYRFTIEVDFVPGIARAQLEDMLRRCRETHGKKMVRNHCPFLFRQRAWQRWIELLLPQPDVSWNQLGKKQQQTLLSWLKESQFQVDGKSTNKEEFVTCGGVDLPQINGKTMASKLFPNLFFAGEVLNIDGVTGGFNFQAAWTTAFLAGRAAADWVK